jgi:hypothetical protein
MKKLVLRFITLKLVNYLCNPVSTVYITVVTDLLRVQPELIRVNSSLCPQNVRHIYVKVKVIPQQAEVAQGVPGRLRLRIFLTFGTYEGGRSSAIRTGCLYPRRNPWYSFSGAESSLGHLDPTGRATETNPH